MNEMKERNRVRATLAIVATIAALSNVSSAQTGGGFDLSWNVCAGGAISQGGGFKLAGVSGQAVAGASLGGGSFDLRSGFLQDSGYFPVPVVVSSFSID